MKKQFTKIKIAAENLSRSNKPDRKDFELEVIEKQVDKYRDVLDRMVRKLPAVSGSNTPTDPQEREKRIKKNTHFKIGLALEESAEELPKELPLHYVLANCGDLEKSIAECIIDSELQTEIDVVRRLKVILDNEIQKISTLKRNVSRTVQEHTSLKRSYEAAIRLDEPLTKISNIKDQQEQCEVKLEKERDMWAAAMFELISREDEIVHCVRDYVRNQQNFYKRTLHKVNTSLARIEDMIQGTEKSRFDTPLLEHLSSSQRQISYILELCVCCLLENGLYEEGLLRVGCSKTKLRRMKHALEAQYIRTPLPAEYQDPHVIASLLKDYLRVLPEPLLTFDCYKDFIKAAERNTEEERKADIKATLAKLPLEHFANLRYLTKFLSLVTQHADRNKMNSQNLAIVMSPNMLRPRIGKSSTAGDYLDQVNSSSAVNLVVELMISQWDYFFDGEVEFFVTLQRNKLFAEGGRFTSSKSNSSNENLDRNENDGLLESPRYGTLRRTKPCAPSPPTKVQENKSQNHSNNNNCEIQQKAFAVVAPATGVAIGVGINNEDLQSNNHHNGETTQTRRKELFAANGIGSGEKPEKPPLPKVLQLQQQLQQQQPSTVEVKPVPMTRTQFFGLDNLPSPTADRKSSDSSDSRNSMTFKPDLPQKPRIPKRPMVLGLTTPTATLTKSDDESVVETKPKFTSDELKMSSEKLIEMLRQENCDNAASQAALAAHTHKDNNNHQEAVETSNAIPETNLNDFAKNNIVTTRQTPTTPISPNTVQTPKRPTVCAPPPPIAVQTTTTTTTSTVPTCPTPTTPKRPIMSAPPPPTANVQRKLSD